MTAHPTARGSLAWVAVPVTLFAVTRLATLLVAWLATIAEPISVGDVLSNWDGNWNQIIAERGYVELDPSNAVVTHPFMTLAFFPVLPLSARWLDAVTGIGIVNAGVGISLVAAAVGTVVLWRLLDRRVGPQVATASTLLLLLSPHAFVLSMFYTEGLTLLFVAVTFDALDRRSWELAGIAALAGGAVRPSGFVLVVPCLVAALIVWRRDGSWRPFAAPLLAPLGFLAWLAYVWHRTGDPLGYVEIQREGWGAGIDFGATTLGSIWDVMTLQWDDANAVMSAIAIVLGVVGVVLAVRQRIDPTWTWYAAALVLLTAVNERQASAARFLLPAFPLYVAYVCAAGPRWRGLVVGTSAFTMGALFLLSSTTLLYTP